MSELLRLENVTRRYREGEGQLEVFSGLNLSLKPGEIVALVGQSGSGKSSLLHMAGLLEAPTSGEIYIHGEAASKLPDSARTRIRRTTIGFVYQAHHLLPEFDALENIVLPQMIAGKSRAAAAVEAARLLTSLGLGARLTHRPSQLLWRRAAARRHRPRPGQQTENSSGRRTHWQSRSPHRGRGVRFPDRHHPRARAGGGADRHPQFRTGGAHGPRPAAASGQAGRRHGVAARLAAALTIFPGAGRNLNPVDGWLNCHELSTG